MPQRPEGAQVINTFPVYQAPMLMQKRPERAQEKIKIKRKQKPGHTWTQPANKGIWSQPIIKIFSWTINYVDRQVTNKKQVLKQKPVEKTMKETSVAAKETDFTDLVQVGYQTIT